MARILVIRKVACPWVCSRGGPLGEGVLAVWRKRVLGIGSMGIMAKRHQLTCGRLCTTWKSVLETRIRHHTRRISVRGGLRYMSPASTGMARRGAWSCLGRRIRVVVVVFDVQSFLMDGLRPWPSRPTYALQFASTATAAVALVAGRGVRHRCCVARRGSFTMRDLGTRAPWWRDSGRGNGAMRDSVVVGNSVVWGRVMLYNSRA